MPFLQNCSFVFVEKSRDQMINCLCQKTCKRNRLADLIVKILFTSAKGFYSYFDLMKAFRSRPCDTLFE